MGAEVLGVDPVEVSVRTAELHSSLDPALRGRVRYRACTLEDLTEEEGNEDAFDAIVASEVLEHLADLDTFVHCCYRMLKVWFTLSQTSVPDSDSISQSQPVLLKYKV